MAALGAAPGKLPIVQHLAINAPDGVLGTTKTVDKAALRRRMPHMRQRRESGVLRRQPPTQSPPPQVDSRLQDNLLTRFRLESDAYAKLEAASARTELLSLAVHAAQRELAEARRLHERETGLLRERIARLQAAVDTAAARPPALDFWQRARRRWTRLSKALHSAFRGAAKVREARLAADRLRDARDWTAASAAYAKVLALNPALTDIWVQYGHTLKEGGDAVHAEAAYLRALDQNEGDFDIHLNLGHLYKVTGRLPEAAKSYRAALALNPASDDAAAEVHALAHLL